MTSVRAAVSEHFRRGPWGEAYGRVPEDAACDEVIKVLRDFSHDWPEIDAHTRLLVVPIFIPQATDSEHSLPFAAVVCAASPETWKIGNLACFAFLREFRHLLWFEDELTKAIDLRSLLLEFAASPSPEAVAEIVTRYLTQHFRTSEVAILEKRGDYLALLQSAGVPESNVPPLRLSGTKALVCSVARSKKPHYDRDVHENTESEPYLSVNLTTKSQYAVPLIWQGDAVGVLLVANSVLDGLPARHQTAISAIAAHCAAAVANGRRAQEEWEVRNLTTQVLRRALFRMLKSDAFQDCATTDSSSGVYCLLQEFLRNLNAFHQVSGFGGAPDNLGVVDLAAALDAYLKSPAFRSLAARAPLVRVEWNRAAGNYEVITPTACMERVFHVLICNAYEAISETGLESGQISVTMRIETREVSSETLPYVVMGFRDTGIGLSESVLSSLFKVGFTTKSHGVGLSLAVTNRIIQSCGGWLEPENVPAGAGANFELWLPLICRDGET